MKAIGAKKGFRTSKAKIPQYVILQEKNNNKDS